MASNIDQDVSQLKAKIDVAVRARVRAEHERDSAQRAAEVALDRLRAEFGVSSLSEAKELLVSMETELHGVIAEITHDLDSIGV